MRKIILLFLLTGLSAQAADLDAATGRESIWLRKASFHLRGKNPTPKEYQELSQSTDKAAYLRTKLDEYLATESFVQDLRFRLFENLRMENSRTWMESKTSAQLLVEKIIREDRSWDQLWLAKDYDYRILAPTGSFSDIFNQTLPFQQVSDQAFYTDLEPRMTKHPGLEEQIEPQASSQKLEKWTADFADDDPRLAGIITTPRFTARFANSGLNKGRRRAAVLFRVLLCDAMSLSIEGGDNARREEIDAAFGVEGVRNEEEALIRELENSPDSRHGTDPNCMACHYKLDPMGKALNSLGATLSAHPFRGALVYKSPKRQMMVNEKVSGLGALTAKIVQQPEYRSCQTSWFWSKYMGKDVILSADRQAELDRKFDELGRRPRAFVRYLLLQPEFIEKPKVVDEMDFGLKIKPLLQRCDRCHQESGEFVPEMAIFPVSITGDAAEHGAWIKRMKDRVFLPESNRHRMPKNWRDWDPKDLDLLKKWLEQGARYGT